MLSCRSTVESCLKARLITDANAPYKTKGLNLTPTLNGAPTTFPTLFVKTLGEPSTSDDLEQKEQSAIISTVELHSYSNTSLTDAYSLANKSGDVMLSMSYSLIAGPEPLSLAKPFEIVTRFRRFVGAGDVL